MSRFIDGPAAGVQLQLRRAPLMLRVVQNAQGKWDALDQPTDDANADEKIFVYRLTEKPTTYHLLVRGKNRGAGGWFMDGTYRLLVPQPDDVDVRLNGAWDRWCDLNKEHLVPAWAKEWLSND
jgi:hypothetical protein